MTEIDRFRQRLTERPEWAHLLTLELDCLLAGQGDATLVTMSRQGMVSASDTAPPSARALDGDDAVARAARLLATGRRAEAMRWLHDHARGESIHAANLLYANAGCGDDVWLHFVNKYLRRFGVPVLRLVAGGAPRLLRLAGSSSAGRPAPDGPNGVPGSATMVSVLMPIRNAVATVGWACRSMLTQSWDNLELIVIDDASTDGTWDCLLELAAADERLKPIRLAQPVGPHVACNIALAGAAGHYVATHGSDRFALPDRLERQLRPLLDDPSVKVSVARTLQLAADGRVSRFAPVGSCTHDGALFRSDASALFERSFFERRIGAWDAVRGGADEELLARVSRFAAGSLRELAVPATLTLAGSGAPAHPSELDEGDPATSRLDKHRYRQAWRDWHAGLTHMPRLPFPLATRSFEAPKHAAVDLALQQQNVERAPRAPVTVSPAASADGKAAENALWRTAQRLRDCPDARAALAQAHAELSEAERPALELLWANLVLDDDTAWLGHVNRYIEWIGDMPLALKAGGGERFWRLAAGFPAPITNGPLVSVLMPAHNAAASLAFAARSVLAQSWQPLELIIVDDASDDETASIARAIARDDERVKLLCNRANVGPYVSKNFGLQVARGAYVTCHDADDWAHPRRIEQQVAAMQAGGTERKAMLMGMLRCEATGRFSRISRTTVNSRDGGLQAALVSTIFEAGFLRDTLGHWDEVRFAGDSELIGRAEQVLGRPLERLHRVGMICLDSPSGLTNHPEHGYSPATGLSDSRKRYRNAFTAWHRVIDERSGRLDFPQHERPFPIPEAIRVDADRLRACIEGHHRCPAGSQRSPAP